ncbi:MAG TPA: M14 family metallopeptidase [Candidatus Acidoferrales bacterium]|nr:M14 family metallopeptidase [Candidatus Acidoferrales bacterium]
MTRTILSRTLLTLLVGTLLAGAASAAPAPFEFFGAGPYRDGVPRPADVLGYDIGTYHTGFAAMERYVDAVLRAAPDRVKREPFGRSVEFRERAVLIISSPGNLARLDAIRAGSARLADPRTCSAAEAANLAKTLPVTVWLNYSMHGDESASFEAMPYVVYQLVAGEDSLTRALRERCVVLVDLAHNPDGHERFVTWINALGQGSPEPWAIEQQRQQPWGIGGRTTHYQFDPNRDALAMSQPESRQSSREIRRWHPQVFVDHHGEVASFFFPPNAPVENEQLADGIYARWSEIFGRANAAAFDRYGWSYYVRDAFDFHEPGYWDIWPSLTGAVGMTYETDGGGDLARRRDDGTIVTMRDGAARHFTAALATVRAAADHREERLRDFRTFAEHSMDVRAGAARGYVIDPGGDPLRAAWMVENLLDTGVEVRWVGDAFTVKDARELYPDCTKTAPTGKPSKDAPPPRTGMPRAEPGPEGPHAFPHGAFVIDLAQPASRVARVLLDADSSPDSAFIKEQLGRYDRNVHRGRRTPHEEYGFYDLTAWALPLSYGVDVYSSHLAPPAGTLLADPDPNVLDEGDEVVPDSLAVGIPLTARISRAGPLVMRGVDGRVALDLRGGVQGGEAATAYVWSCAQAGAQRLALRLEQEDFRVAAATQPLRAGGADWPRGSFIVRVERNPGTLHERIAALARQCGVPVRAVNSAWIEHGDTGIGSEAVQSLKRPHIAILVDDGVSPNAYGALWFLFERRLGVRFTAVRVSSVSARLLDDYNVVIVPDGSPERLADALDDGGIAALREWTSRGGALVCLDDASELPTLKRVGLSSARVVGVPAKPKDEKDDDAPPDSANGEASRRPEEIPGTIFRASVDPRHFLGYGLTGSTLPVLIQGATLLSPSHEGANALRFDRTPLTVTGWTWPETERRVTGTAYAIDEPNGAGHVVMIAGPAAFRGYWRSTERLVLNAVLYAPGRD